MPSQPIIGSPADPRLLQLDPVSWAGESIARGGRRDALLGRVEKLQLSIDGRKVEARVRGNRPLPYEVRIELIENKVDVCCNCSGAQGACRHAVAALEALRFPPTSGGGGSSRRGRTAAGRGKIIQHAAPAPGFVIIGDTERARTRDERLVDAAEEERIQVRKRARSQRAALESIDEPGLAPVWHVVPRTDAGGERVTLWSAEPERFGCSCKEFAENELGSCPHVERVRNHRARQRKSKRRLPDAKLRALWCAPRRWIDCAPRPLEEFRLEPADTSDVPSRFFDDEGWLRPVPDGRRPSVWARAARITAARVARTAGVRLQVDVRCARRIHNAWRVEATTHRRRERPSDERLWTSVIEGVELKLHPYQEEGARFLARQGRAFLADDMGLGKTLQSIVAALLLRRRESAHRVLVVCPASLKHQWRYEIGKVCSESAVVVDGSRAQREAQYRDWSDPFLIVNYELILRDLQLIQQAAPDLVILDEAQRIKNWNTKTARAVKRLRSRFAFVLTGTPLENRLIELHSLVEFLHPRAAGPRWRLLPFHAVSEPRGRIIAYEGLDVLRDRLAAFFLRRERSAVQDQLPDRTDNTFWTSMSEAQLQPYRKHAATLAAVLSRSASLAQSDIRAVLKALTSMRILCNGLAQYEWDRFEPLLGPQADAHTIDIRTLHSPKLEEFAHVMDDLLDEEGRKVVVFSQWERMLRLAQFAIREPLQSRDAHSSIFHGGLSSRARSEMLDAFRSDPGMRVLFSTDAGGLGLNLQDAASIVVNLEVPWNPAIIEQRVGRVHRMGQQHSVQVLHFVTRDALEERVLQVVQDKRALFDGLLVNQTNEVILSQPAAASWLERARMLVGDVAPAAEPIADPGVDSTAVTTDDSGVVTVAAPTADPPADPNANPIAGSTADSNVDPTRG